MRLRALVARPFGLALLLGLLGLILTGGGAWLLTLGGSAYYVIAGLLLLASAVLVWLRRARAAWAYAAFTAATIVWALAESGFDPWALMTRIAGPAVVGLWFAAPWVRRSLGLSRVASLANPALFLAALALLVGSYAATRFEPLPLAEGTLAADVKGGTEWRGYGGDADARRFVPVTQINRTNVASLKPAWTFQTGDKLLATDWQKANTAFQTVPLKIGEALYLCTQHNVVIALDADKGTQLWRYDPRVEASQVPHRTCRGLAYHEQPGASGLCARRLLMGTIDDRLLALDLATGRPCPGFGTGGAVDLTRGLGPMAPGWHYVTSPPIVVRNIAVVGAFIFDNQSTDEPPGVVRAYDVNTGKLRWAWDVLGAKGRGEPGPGESYARNTANFWSIGSADAALGLVYVPMGNTPPDFFGGKRTAAQDRYPSSIVALDAETGDVRWSFQTVHHDIWDYDVGSQPVLVDMPMRGGRTVPALIQPTKRGEVFILDRATGRPLFPIVEKPVPQGPAPGERLSPTQPYQTGFPSFEAKPLTERAMWGVTPVDQLLCRIAFRQARYEGSFTPPSIQGSIVHPGSYGVMDWGSVSIDPERGLMIVNTSNIPYYERLVPRAEADGWGSVVHGAKVPAAAAKRPKYWRLYPQAGTPYAIDNRPFLSRLGLPCNQPPWGTIAAVDLASRKVIWRRPFGTTRDAAPLGIALPMGMINLGGTVTTRGGLTFIGAAIDNYLRAFDTRTGEELWRGRLPAGGQSNPISYVSGRTGRQYVVIAAGGNRALGTTLGDYVVAFALPEKR